MKKIEVSVIIPSYNSAFFINETLQSVYQQTFKNYEIIFIDDGSTDNTKELLLKNHNSVRYYYQENQGPASARNKGIHLARGKYIAFLDADDLWKPNKLELQINEFLKNKKLEIITTNLINVDKHLNFINERENKVSKHYKHFLRDIYLGKIQNMTPTIMVSRKKALEVGGFPEDLIRREDHFFVMRMISQSNYLHIKESLVVRRRLETGLSSSGKEVFNDDFFVPFIEKSVDEFNQLKKYKKSNYYYFYKSKSHYFWTKLEFKEAKKYILKSIICKKINLKAYVMLLLVSLSVPYEIYQKIRLFSK